MIYWKNKLNTNTITPDIINVSGICPEGLHQTKAACYQAGYLWTGFDPSGHCFLLSWNNLFMVEEFTAAALPLLSSPQVQGGARWSGAIMIKHLQILSCLLCFLIFLGEIMMIFTSLYFHSFLEKFIGTFCGLGTWYVLYQIFYPQIFCPDNIKDWDWDVQDTFVISYYL